MSKVRYLFSFYKLFFKFFHFYKKFLHIGLFWFYSWHFLELFEIFISQTFSIFLQKNFFISGFSPILLMTLFGLGIIFKFFHFAKFFHLGLVWKSRPLSIFIMSDSPHIISIWPLSCVRFVIHFLPHIIYDMCLAFVMPHTHHRFYNRTFQEGNISSNGYERW
jgi:hypothetical protein